MIFNKIFTLQTVLLTAQHTADGVVLQHECKRAAVASMTIQSQSTVTDQQSKAQLLFSRNSAVSCE